MRVYASPTRGKCGELGCGGHTTDSYVVNYMNPLALDCCLAAVAMTAADTRLSSLHRMQECDPTQCQTPTCATGYKAVEVVIEHQQGRCCPLITCDCDVTACAGLEHLCGAASAPMYFQSCCQASVCVSTACDPHCDVRVSHFLTRTKDGLTSRPCRRDHQPLPRSPFRIVGLCGPSIEQRSGKLRDVRSWESSPCRPMPLHLSQHRLLTPTGSIWGCRLCAGCAMYNHEGYGDCY